MIQDSLENVFTGSVVATDQICALLEGNKMEYSLRNRFEEGLHAGFADGIPGLVDIMVLSSDYDKAKILIEKFLKS